MTEVRKYRKRPVVTEAVIWDGTNADQIAAWTGGNFHPVDPEDRGEDPDITAEVFDKLHSTWIGVKTGQYVLKGTLGEYYPHEASNFPTSYEPATTRTVKLSGASDDLIELDGDIYEEFNLRDIAYETAKGA